MRTGVLILGAVVIALASHSAEARGGGGHGGGRAHFGGNRFGHHFGFNRGFHAFGFNRRFDHFDRFGFDRRFNRSADGGWGYGGYGWGYGGYDYPYYTVPPNIVVMLPPTPGAAPARQRVGDLPPCHEVTTFGVVIERGMGCSVPPPRAGAVPSDPARAEDPPPSQVEDPPPSRAEDLRPSEDLPPCREVTPFGVVIERGMACLRGSG